MKSVMNKLVRDEKGAALIVALILLLVGGLLAASLLGYMGTGLITGEIYETRTAELYAADAGVEDAVWIISHQSIEPWLWQESDDYPGWWVYEYPEPLIVNDRSVGVTLYRQDLDPTCGEELVYRILATAMTEDGGGVASIPSSTTVEAYLSASYMDFSSLLDNAIVSDTSISIDNGVLVTGDVTSGGTIDDKTKPGDIDGTITPGADLDWPDADDLSAYYWDDVKDELPYASDTIDIAGVDATKGPLYRDGPLTIKNSSSINATLKLTGTLYITGETKICYNTPNNNEMILDLNGQTIFVASNSTGKGNEALQIGDKCTIIGSGCIIAVGDIYFKPNGDVGGENEFVLVMSIEGTMTLQPGGTFYGCIAGDLAVDVASGNDATIINMGLAEGQDLNLPMGIGDDPNELPPVTGVKIDSWEVSQQ